MSNKIVQSDNAVIDYTTIQSLIDAVNQQQQDIDNLNAGRKEYLPTTGSDGTVSTLKSGVQQIESGYVQITGSSVVIKLLKTYTTRPNITFSTQGAGPVTAWIAGESAWQGFNQVTVSLSAKPTGGRLYWIAVGTV